MNFKKNVAKFLVCAFLLSIPFEASAATITSVAGGKWEHVNKSINCAEITANGNIIAAGTDGRYVILDANTGQAYTTAMYTQPAMSIHDMKTLEDGNILLVGNVGKWILATSSGDEITRGQLARAEYITGVTQLKNGNIVMVQQTGYYTIMNSSLSIIRSGTWVHGNGLNSIYDVEELENGKLISSGGEKSYTIKDVTRLSNDKILAVGTGGRYLLFDKEGKFIKEGLIDSTTSKIWTTVEAVADNYAVVLDEGGSSTSLIKIENNNNIKVVSKMGLKFTTSGFGKRSVRVADNKVFVGSNSGTFEILEIDTSN
ncbi:hypothetical protein ABER61_27950 [Brevibacillus formosus]|uniref:Uncharacterized protein n=1 Tax=Brevibacillus formosus TaxID=54913 RepID=A0A837KDJ3_9BACL|nr:hypothetical protein [Brevibacillus formosus]KLH95860.1 hypothetical protein AA984_28515 [Brevibacillus formosus]MED1955137.1 hypothetical protein [Brevibacillus formosus]PSJ94993.1 hypothetical protein C7R91_16500 [Brevibacillus formosus]GED61428.1 hypothetical protein BFO01nite_55600 [Brevibacillus formosus]